MELTDPCDRLLEPVIDVDDVQGNILGGFRHGHRMLIYCSTANAVDLRALLSRVSQHLTVATDTLDQHRRAFAVNIALSFDCLVRLSPDAEAFTDPAFRAGLAQRAELLGDPEPGRPGGPDSWLIGGFGREADLVVLMAADDPIEVRNGLAALNIPAGAVLRIDRGTARVGASVNREHFGFADGIGQPGVRGRVPGDPARPISSRGRRRRFGQVGDWHDLLWPGEFLFGYPTQARDRPAHNADDRLATSAPDWARNGSYLVVRRLHQNVYQFHLFVAEIAKTLDLDPGLVAARLMGRWPNGAPLLSHPSEPNAFDEESASAQDFDYLPMMSSTGCPVSAHIRKMNPRAISSGTGNLLPNLADTQRHRLLRRGFAYGTPSPSSPYCPLDDGLDRGLIFLAYQTSIDEQFEFIVRRWANETNFPEPVSGYDPIIGQNHRDGTRRRWFHLGEGQAGRLSTTAEWVVPTGGGYFFAPGRRGLAHLAGLSGGI